MRSTIQFLILFLVLLFGCSKDSTTKSNAFAPEDLLVKDQEISGWQRSGDFWVASSNSDLNHYIDGEAVIYTNFGFVEAAKQSYEGKVTGYTETVELRIFDQGKSANAKSVFEEMLKQMSSPIEWTNGAGEEAMIERFAISQRIIFWHSKFFVTLTITSGLDEALEVLKLFANNVDSNI
jgi:hypothetical protein